MADILIRGMEMPSIELEWRIIRDQDGKWYAIDVNAETTDGEWHEIVPVPEHGRLGDLDKLEDGLRNMAKYQSGDRQQGILGCCETIRMTPTVIPASAEDINVPTKLEEGER